jgi:collagenase-like PrtC family protease
MCVSESGRCFTSQFLFNESANRGKCIHPCRRAYTVKDEEFPFKSPFDETMEEEVSGDNILLPAMQIQGMIWKSSRPQAIINNKLYDVKDIINVAGEEIEVKDINKDGVHLMYKYKEFIVGPK